MADYHHHIDTSYASLTKEIVESYTPRPKNEVQAAAAVHNNLHREIQYDSRWDKPMGRAFRDIKQITRQGGNCEERGVLLSSLLKPYKDIDIQLFSVDNPQGDGHLTAALRFNNRSKDFVRNTLSEFYYRCNTISPYSNFFFKQNWIIADVDIEHLGQPGWMVTDNYFVKDNSGNYRFYKLKKRIPVS